MFSEISIVLKKFLSVPCTDLNISQSSTYCQFYMLLNWSKWLLSALLQWLVRKCYCIAVACTALALVCMLPLIHSELRMSLIFSNSS